MGKFFVKYKFPVVLRSPDQASCLQIQGMLYIMDCHQISSQHCVRSCSHFTSRKRCVLYMLCNVTALRYPIMLPYNLDILLLNTFCHVCYCFFLDCVHFRVVTTHSSLLFQLTVPLIKIEMEKTLQWLVPIATNTTK